MLNITPEKEEKILCLVCGKDVTGLQYPEGTIVFVNAITRIVQPYCLECLAKVTAEVMDDRKEES